MFIKVKKPLNENGDSNQVLKWVWRQTFLSIQSFHFWVCLFWYQNYKKLKTIFPFVPVHTILLKGILWGWEKIIVSFSCFYVAAESVCKTLSAH